LTKARPTLGDIPRDSDKAHIISLVPWPYPVEVAVVLGLDLLVIGRDMDVHALDSERDIAGENEAYVLVLSKKTTRLVGRI